MSKFIGLKRRYEHYNSKGELAQVRETSVILNLEDISFVEVEDNKVRLRCGDSIFLNKNSTKFLLEILMENEYKLQGVEE